MTNVRGKNKKHYKIYRAIEELGLENFYIEFVEAWPCENRGQLNAREGHYIRQFDSVKNGYNDRVAGRTRIQWQKEEYYSNNEFRENRLKYYREYKDEKYREEYNKKRSELYQSDEKFREDLLKKNREYRLRKKAERMHGPAQTDSLELN